MTPEQINQIRAQDGLPPVQSVTGANSVDRSKELQDAWGISSEQTPAPAKNFSLGLKPNMAQPSKVPGLVEPIKKTATGLLGSEISLGQDIAVPGNRAILDKATQEHSDMEKKLSDRISQMKESGQDTSRLESALVSLNAAKPTEEQFSAIKPSGEKVAGDILGTGLDFATAGLLPGGGEIAGKALGQTAKEAAIAGAKIGGGYGAAQGLASGLQQEKSAGGVIGNTIGAGVVGAATGGALSGGLAKIGEIAQNVPEKGLIGATKEAIGKEPTLNKTIDLLKGTEDTMTKGERIQAIGEGRVRPTKLGGKEFVPSETEKRAASILDGKLKSNPVKNVPIIQKEISDRGIEAEKYLADNAKKITNKEHANMFASKKAEMEKYNTEPEIKAYDDVVNLFSKQLPGRGSYDTNTYYKALKDFESNVASKLPKGKEAIIDPTGIASAKIHAASDVRKVVRDMIGEKNPEFKSKMFDLASLYDVADTMKVKADRLSGNVISRFAKKHPYVTGGVGTAIAGETGKRLLTGNF